LLIDPQVHILCVKFRENIDEVGEGPSSAIDRRYENDIELSTCRPFPTGIECRPLFSAFGPTDSLIHELLNNLPPVSFSHQPKLTQLVVPYLTRP
jgi:hypothetical protein